MIKKKFRLKKYFSILTQVRNIISWPLLPQKSCNFRYS